MLSYHRTRPAGLMAPLYGPWLVVSLLTVRPPTALAQQQDWDGGFDEAEPEHRSDFMVGLVGGLMLGEAAGYPNEADKIGEPQFESDTGFAFGNGGGLFFGAALLDEFTIGLGLSGGAVQGSDLLASGGAFVFRAEAFPLYALGGAFKDLGLFSAFGAGGMTILMDDQELADGGATSYLAFGAFFEALRVWRIAAGPLLEYSHMYSRSITSNQVALGMRTAFYGGP